MEDLENILNNAVIGLSLLLSLLFLFNFKKFNAVEMLFGFYMTILAVFEFIAWASIHVFEVKNNIPGLHAFTFFEFITLGFFMMRSMTLFHFKPPITTILTIGSILIILNSMYVQDIYIYNSYSIAGVKFFIIAMSIFFFYWVLLRNDFLTNDLKPTVYFFTAIFFKASVELTFYLYGNFLVEVGGEGWKQINFYKISSTFMAYLTMLAGIYFILSRDKNTPIQESQL